MMVKFPPEQEHAARLQGEREYKAREGKTPGGSRPSRIAAAHDTAAIGRRSDIDGGEGRRPGDAPDDRRGARAKVTQTMTACLRTLYRHRKAADFQPRAFAGIPGYALVSQLDFNRRALLAWFPAWCVDRLMGLDLIADDGSLTRHGLAEFGEGVQ